ncbi:dTDP-4-dehydrorhamnose 3,5-epimerase [Chitinilyticum litopenaei]|uniref:dTDP-4-dehydrorhamnose 3,5-epimerase n=1 Tax=Chitinilyticum litopenaei TaxID=1121276 RepID=UPI00048E9AA5|nr:dTDP-4-dehydrorhamnose 3,5-epimerase [Chitinilyticum litopenaei]
MHVIDTPLPGLKVIEPKAFGDERGFFFESFNRASFARMLGRDIDFVQDNHSSSRHGVLRGLHYQRPPNAQAKLVRCTAGAVFDVAVDMRRSSSAFGRWFGLELSAENRKQLWIPEGFAHGFLVTGEQAEVQYKTSAYWSPQDEEILLWCDPFVGVRWPDGLTPILSEKDAKGRRFDDAHHFP